MTRRRIIGILLCVSVLVAIWWSAQNRLTVVNGTGQNIGFLKIRVGDDTHYFGDIPPGGEVSFRFHFIHHAIAEFIAILEDGTEIEDFSGYFTWEEDLLGGIRETIMIDLNGPGVKPKLTETVK